MRFDTITSMLQNMRMVPVTLVRALKRGALSIFREEGWGTAIGSLFGLFLLLQVIILLSVGVQGGLQLLRERTDLRLQIRPTASDPQIQDLIQNIRNLPYVEDVIYITREQAYERAKKRDPTLVEFLIKFGIDNPFPDTLGVQLVRLQDFRLFLDFLRQPVFSAAVDPKFLTDTTDQKEQVDQLLQLVASARTILAFVIGFASIVLLFVVVELIRRRALMKRQELFVEQLVGASRADILLPFMVEMGVLLFIALLASLLTSVALLFLLPFFLPILGASGGFAPWVAASGTVFWHWLPWLLIGETSSVVLLSVLATLIAFKSQLKAELLPTASFH